MKLFVVDWDVEYLHVSMICMARAHLWDRTTVPHVPALALHLGRWADRLFPLEDLVGSVTRRQ